MFETSEEMGALQDLLDRSFAGAGGHLTGIVNPGRRLNAKQVANYLVGVKHVSFATASSKGDPFAAPLDGWFLRGQFVVSTSASALRVAHVRRRPQVSLAHVVGDDIGIWTHGQARIAAPDEPLVVEYDRVATETYGSSPFSWGDIVVMLVEPRVMFAYAQDPVRWPE
jgi:hypothetical protein